MLVSLVTLHSLAHVLLSCKIYCGTALACVHYVCTRVGKLITDLPKLNVILPSYTWIGWKYPVSKEFLPETKFGLSIFPDKVNYVYSLKTI